LPPPSCTEPPAPRSQSSVAQDAAVVGRRLGPEWQREHPRTAAVEGAGADATPYPWPSERSPRDCGHGPRKAIVDLDVRALFGATRDESVDANWS